MHSGHISRRSALRSMACGFGGLAMGAMAHREAMAGSNPLAPRMLHHGNIDTATGKYQLGNVFKEPTIHARTNSYDFVSVYGSLKPGEVCGCPQ